MWIWEKNNTVVYNTFYECKYNDYCAFIFIAQKEEVPLINAHNMTSTVYKDKLLTLAARSFLSLKSTNKYF